MGDFHVFDEGTLVRLVVRARAVRGAPQRNRAAMRMGAVVAPADAAKAPVEDLESYETQMMG